MLKLSIFPGRGFWQSSREQPYKVLNCDLVAAVVDLNVVAVDVNVLVLQGGGDSPNIWLMSWYIY
jgi:hypothetical protein